MDLQSAATASQATDAIQTLSLLPEIDTMTLPERRALAVTEASLREATRNAGQSLSNLAEPSQRRAVGATLLASGRDMAVFLTGGLTASVHVILAAPDLQKLRGTHLTSHARHARLIRQGRLTRSSSALLEREHTHVAQKPLEALGESPQELPHPGGVLRAERADRMNAEEETAAAITAIERTAGAALLTLMSASKRKTTTQSSGTRRSARRFAVTDLLAIK